MATSFCSPSSLGLQLVFYMFFLFLLPLSKSVYFKINSFDVDATNILYSGHAMPSVRTIEFNKVNYLTRVGQANRFDTEIHVNLVKHIYKTQLSIVDEDSE